MIKFNEYLKNKIVFSYEISLACNLRCSYCYELKLLDNKKTHNTEIANLVIEKLTEFKKENPNIELELDLLGGDPLMAPNLIEFITELSKIDIVIWIVTNLTFSKERIEEVGKLLELPNVGIAATWHDNINDDVFKENVLTLEKYSKHQIPKNMAEKWLQADMVLSFVLFDENEKMFERANWALNNNIPYVVTHLYNNGERVQAKNSWNEKTEFVFENSLNNSNLYYLDDKKISSIEFQEKKLYQISQQYTTICEPLTFNISYYGYVNFSCQMKNKKLHQYHIRDGLKKFRLFCNSGDCYCSECGYKELYGKKNAN
jgi:organic radical activating enzyme